MRAVCKRNPSSSKCGVDRRASGCTAAAARCRRHSGWPSTAPPCASSTARRRSSIHGRPNCQGNSLPLGLAAGSGSNMGDRAADEAAALAMFAGIGLAEQTAQ